MEIVEFEPAHAEAFRRLNEAWISKHFTLEPKDREVLGDPQGKIIVPGGRALEAGADLFMCKPVTAKALLTALASAMCREADDLSAVA